MNIFDYAMKMEKDGKQFYLDLADKNEDKGVKSIFHMLAEDEEKHYGIFLKMKSGEGAYEMAETEILKNVRNIFTEMKGKERNLTFTPSQKELYEKAREMEAKSRDFYLEKGEETESAAHKKLFLRIAGEEQRHFNLLENMLEFISRPQTWLENAEFSHIGEEY